MNVHTIGIDIEEIKRFTALQYKERESFYKKIFTEQEIKYCLSNTEPYSHFAVRFCAKEATIKALDSKKISFKDIEIIMNESKPILKIHKKIKGQVSLSHTKQYAIAMVMI